MSSVVNVMIGDHCVKNVVQELARCLAIFPNLHTFKFNHTKLTVSLDEATSYGFRPYEAFPQIRSITVPTDCEYLLIYFPGARRVHIIGSLPVQSDNRVSFFATHCPLMENISLSIPSRVEFLSSLLFRYRLTSVTCS